MLRFERDPQAGGIDLYTADMLARKLTAVAALVAPLEEQTARVLVALALDLGLRCVNLRVDLETDKGGAR